MSVLQEGINMQHLRTLGFDRRLPLDTVGCTLDVIYYGFVNVTDFSIFSVSWR